MRAVPFVLFWIGTTGLVEVVARLLSHQPVFQHWGLMVSVAVGAVLSWGLWGIALPRKSLWRGRVAYTAMCLGGGAPLLISSILAAVYPFIHTTQP